MGAQHLQGEDLVFKPLHQAQLTGSFGGRMILEWAGDYSKLNFVLSTPSECVQFPHS